MVPPMEECLSLLKKSHVPEHIIEHSRKVCGIAACLGRLLNGQGAGLNEGKIAAASWLHDIAKMDGLRSGENHSAAGAALGYRNRRNRAAARGARRRDHERGSYYADKRVKHTVLSR
jgi:HD superfamily phosphodiesterase